MHITKEQTEFFHSAFLLGTDVVYAPFGSVKEIEAYRAHAAKAKELFSKEVRKESKDVLYRASMGEIKRLALSLLYYVNKMSKETSVGGFIESHNYLDSYLGEEIFVDYLRIYGIDND